MLRAISLAIGVIIAIIVVSMGYGLDTWQFWSIMPVTPLVLPATINYFPPSIPAT